MKDPEKVREALRKYYPEMVYSDMDGSFFWKSLEEYSKGDIFTHEGRDYEVLYSWPWWEPYGVTVYCAELKPLPIS